ncbi:GNAT family N-acetyltransferase [Sediminicola sp. 1XM1-17]|uniref:GNAT family N-acetyltransferase n=1 Tax=Sediminicola sp. 1XM1-17 TaxID=3127702 RepID=UPI0030775D5A
MGIHIKIIPANATWKLRQEVMWPNKPLEYVKLPEDLEGRHFGLYENEKLLSVVSLFVKEDMAQFRKLATMTQEQNKGYGSQILEHVLKEAQKQGVKRIWCNARKDKVGFYHKFGLQETSITFRKDHIDYVVMEKTLP